MRNEQAQLELEHGAEEDHREYNQPKNEGTVAIDPERKERRQGEIPAPVAGATEMDNE